MTNEEFYRINALKDEIESYEKILENKAGVKKQLKNKAGCPGEKRGENTYYKIHDNLPVFDKKIFDFGWHISPLTNNNTR